MNKKFKYRTIIVIALVIIGALIYCLSPVRNRFSGLRPEDQNNTTWISEIPKIILNIDYNNHFCSSGKIFLNNTINVAFFFDTGRSVLVDDIDKIVYQTESDGERGMNDSKALVFWGECDFSTDCCKITVTKSNVDEIKVGDEIVLYRQ